MLSKRWKHHSKSSGYDQLAKRLGGRIPHVDRTRMRHRWIPEPVAQRLVWRSGVELYTLDSFYQELAAARDMLRKPRPSVYHLLYGDETYRYLGEVKRLRRHRLVATYHQPSATLRKRLRHTDHIRHLDAVILMSRSQRSFFEEHLDPERIFCVPHGIDTHAFAPDSGRPSENGARTCLFVGSHQRDIEVLRDVATRVVARRSDVRFVVVSDRKVLAELAGLRQVELLHDVQEDELLRLYQSAALLIQPLEDCTANNAILEGLSCGLPVVATSVGGVGDYLDETCGILVPPRDADQMVAAVLRVLEEPGLRRRLSLAARQKALEFDWSRSVAQLTSIYARLLEPGAEIR